MSFKDDLINERIANNEKEEAEAEAQADRQEGYDSDRVFDEIQEDNTIELMELTSEIIEKAKKMIYYRDNDERIAKDIIENTLRTLNFKIGEITDITPNFQELNLEKRENEVK
jgi:hypothetical protein